MYEVNTKMRLVQNKLMSYNETYKCLTVKHGKFRINNILS